MQYFLPEDGGPAIPLNPIRQQVQEVMFPADSVDPNLLLFGFGVLAVVAFLGYVAYLAHRK